jgi:hypothetical protein
MVQNLDKTHRRIPSPDKTHRRMPSPDKKKHNIIKNSFTIPQIKKMIGKKLLTHHPSINISVKEKNNAKLMKVKFIEDIGKKSKNIILTVSCSNGILYVFRNLDIYLMLCGISYKELEEPVLANTVITVLQYPKLTKIEINEFK